MAKLDTRLVKLEGSLSPRQFVYKLIDDNKRFNSLDECSLHYCAGGWKLLPKNGANKIFKAIEDQMKKEKKDLVAIRKACTKASNEMLFLHYLSVRACSSFITDKYRHSYNRLYLDVLLIGMKSDGEEGENKTERMQSSLKAWKHRATRHLYHLYTEKYTVEELGKRYYEGRDLLFKAERELLESMIKNAEHHIEQVNAVTCKDEDNVLGLAEYTIDLEAVKQDVLAHLEDAVIYEVDMAKAEVYSHTDMCEKSYDILGVYADKEMAASP